MQKETIGPIDTRVQKPVDNDFIFVSESMDQTMHGSQTHLMNVKKNRMTGGKRRRFYIFKMRKILNRVFEANFTSQDKQENSLEFLWAFQDIFWPI